MKGRGHVLLVLLGLVWVCVPQRFRPVPQTETWTEAQRHCRETFSDLATIPDADADTEAQQAAGTDKIWIGLRQSPWRWSEDITMETQFTVWGLMELHVRECAITTGGFWFSRDCGDLHRSVCYSAAEQRHVLVQEPMSWFDAQSFCRLKYTDLSSITSISDNIQITALVMTSDLVGFSPVFSAWFGLHRAPLWSDGSNASYRRWAELDGTADCVLMDPSSAAWFRRPCSEKHAFLCQTGESSADPDRTSALWAVSIRLRGSADLNDPTVTDAILQQLQSRLAERDITEGVELRWRRSPDRRIITREKTTPPADHMCEAVWSD